MSMVRGPEFNANTAKKEKKKILIMRLSEEIVGFGGLDNRTRAQLTWVCHVLSACKWP